MSTEPNVIALANEAYERVATKVVAFSEAYIFVLEGSVKLRQTLRELADTSAENEPVTIEPKSMMASMLRLSRLLAKSEMEFEEYFRSILFVDLISSTESYFSDLIRAVIRQYPQKAGRIQFYLVDILNAADKNELVARAADTYVQKLMYEKPEDYLEKLCDILAISAEPVKEKWPEFIEAKARRDLGVHNKWTCNSTYIRKVTAAGLAFTGMEGDRMSPKDLEYCEGITEAILKIAGSIHRQVVEKYS